MTTAIDVAKYILEKCGTMTAMKLQKLVYYSQAWSLVWDERALFDNRIEAWANGPVVVDLYSLHKGKFELTELPQGDASKVDAIAAETINAVIDAYGELSAFDLSNLTHSEKPWIDARCGLEPGERGSNPITEEAMADFYTLQYQSMIANQSNG